MVPLTWAQLEANADRVDAAALGTPEIDRYCSSSLWAMPAHLAFAAQRRPWLRQAGEAYALFAADEDARGLRVLQPLEPVWGLGCPLLGEPEPLVEALAHELEHAEVGAVLVTGLAPDGRAARALVRSFSPGWRILGGPTARRYVASLEGGLDGFLGRRSKSLRKSLRRGAERAAAMGLSYEVATGGDADALYARVLAAEALSWKGREGTGLAAPEMRAFYALQLPRLLRGRGLRLVFARLADQDVGFYLGGVFGDTLRGLQFSYAAELSHLGLGALLQVEVVRALSAEPAVRRYDLGSDVAYKQRWGELVHDTEMLALVR